MLTARRHASRTWRKVASSTRSPSPDRWRARCDLSPSFIWRAPWNEEFPMTITPKKVTIRSYHVGFGDCFLLSFQYADHERHVLIDFGSTGVPKDTKLGKRMTDIANDIKLRTKGKLHAVVATHRHKDHISGFETKKGGKGTGDTIRSLKPELVVQPWTENPKLGTDATGPKDGTLGGGTGMHVAELSAMQTVAAATLLASKSTRYFDPS